MSAGVPGRQGPRLGTMGEPEQQGRDGEGGGWMVEECGGGGVRGVGTLSTMNGIARGHSYSVRRSRPPGGGDSRGVGRASWR